jgi:hypothetical protein
MHEDADVTAPIPDYLAEHFTEDQLSPLQALKQKIATWYSQSAADQVQIAGEGQVGNRIRAYDFLPDIIVADAVTKVSLHNDGWFPNQALDWQQPSGSHDAYDAGVLVTHEGKTWKSDVDGNVWEPPEQWTEVDAPIL